MVNWDPGSRSAISDLEVENREVEDTLYSIDYPVEGSDRVLTVATVRPETMLADTAVAVNPDDERYADLVGEHCVLPLVGRRLPIIADEHVDVEFGTGALKITPGHDPNDFEIGRKHGLEEIGVIGPDGRMTEEAGERFAGLTVAEAQDAVVAALREEGALRAEEPYTHSVPFSHRSGERIEPLISLQWFCRMDELAKPAIEVVERDEVRIAPDQWKRVYLDWMREIRPWCVSRQLWWGHRIPVWYCDACEETYRRRAGARRLRRLRRRAAPGGGRPRHLVQLGALALRDPRLARRDAELRAFYPTSFLTTAREILFLWVARMVMTGIEFAGDDPVQRRLRPLGDPGPRRAADVEEPRHRDRPARRDRRARRRRPALRAAGDVLDPGRALLRRQGPAGPRPRQQALERLPADPAECKFERRSTARRAALRRRDRTVEDRWILSRLERTIASVTAKLDAYDFAHAAQEAYSFFWSELCDWYLEIVKPRLYDGEAGGLGDAALRRSSGSWRCCTRSCPSSPRRSGRTTRPRRATSSSTRSRRPTSRCSTRPPRATSRAGSS